MDGKKTTLSFGFSKKKEAPQLKTSIIKEDEDIFNADDTSFIETFDGKQLYSGKKKELVIPLIQTNKWQVRARPEDLEKDDEKGEEKELAKVEGDSVEAQAANELIKEANRELKKQRKQDSGFSVPLLLVNKVPDGFETDDKLDVSLRPEGSVDADYDQVPIEAYGLAMLRGMGWKDGQGIGKDGKLVKPLNPVLRPKGMGLGADRSKAKQTQDVKGETDGSTVQLDFRKGVHCLITNGKHKDSYGTIEGTDEDNSRLMVKMAISGSSITLSMFGVQLVTKKDFDKNSKILNKTKVDKYKEEQGQKQDEDLRRERKDRDNRDKHRDRHQDKNRERESHNTGDTHRETNGSQDRHSHDREQSQGKDRKRKHENSNRDHRHSKIKSSSPTPSRSNPQRLWLRSHLRVRIVDPEYKKGKHFKSKVIVEDVISHNKCICRTEEGKVLEELCQSMLETVIPRGESAHVMIVKGTHLGKLAVVLQRDAGACKAVVQLLEDRDKALSLDYDALCEYTGNIDDAFDY